MTEELTFTFSPSRLSSSFSSSLPLFSNRRERMRRDERGGRKKEKEKPFFFSFSFLRVVSLCFPRDACPALSLLFFQFSLQSLTLLKKFPLYALSPKISPEPELSSSPSTKETTLDEASCLCGRGKMMCLEDVMLGIQFIGQRAENIALSATATGFLSSRNFVSLHELHVSQQARGESRNPDLFLLQSRGSDVICFGRHRLRSILSRCRGFRGKKTLTCALVAEQSRTRPASRGRSTALGRMAEGCKGGSKGRERRRRKGSSSSILRKQRRRYDEKKCVARDSRKSLLDSILKKKKNLDENCPPFSFETQSGTLFFAFPVPSSSFPGQPRRLPGFYTATPAPSRDPTQRTSRVHDDELGVCRWKGRLISRPSSLRRAGRRCSESGAALRGSFLSFSSLPACFTPGELAFHSLLTSTWR